MAKYDNHAIVGNSKILACFTEKGELIRFYYPNIDYFQNIDLWITGIVKDHHTNWLHEGNTIRQYYEENIVYTEIEINEIKILQRDYILPEQNVLVRNYKMNQKVDFLVYSKLNSDSHHLVSGMMKDNALIQYSQEIYLATYSPKSVDTYQINQAKYQIGSGDLKAEDYIGMSPDSAVCYKEVEEITLYLLVDSNLEGIQKKIEELKEEKEELLYRNTNLYWKNFRSQKMKRIPPNLNEKEEHIIARTILLFALLADQETGGIIATPDVDEMFSKCGRYGYCWPRDALFITKALAICNMDERLEKFYHVWAKKAQLDNGYFEQRYYVNGNLAPSWGIQIDETASILIGIERLDKIDGLEEMVLKACEALMSFLDERYLAKPCYDLWEERKGVHFYSTASIYGGLTAGRDILKRLGKKTNDFMIQKIEEFLPKIKEAVQNYFVEEGMIKRSLDNTQVDISVLGAVVPFTMFNGQEEWIKNTVNQIEACLKAPNGGYFRYQYDNYIGGNAWIISSLWLALYYQQIGEKQKAKELFDWVTNHADEMGFLPEQIDKNGENTIWIRQLAWSHAMYVIVKQKLEEEKNLENRM